MGSFNYWFDECNKHQVKEGCTKDNIALLGNVNEIISMNARNCAMLYFCLNTLKIDDVRTMYLSTMKQREFLKVAKGFLKRYKVEDKWVSTCKADVTKLYNRQSHIWLITRENIRLTEYYPYFQEVGFEKLLDFNLATYDVSDQLQYILEDFKNWKADNQDKVDKHMAEVETEIKARDDFRKRKEADKKAEKEAKKLAKKKADDEVKEIRENNRKFLERERRLEKSFARYYK